MINYCNAKILGLFGFDGSDLLYAIAQASDLDALKAACKEALLANGARAYGVQVDDVRAKLMEREEAQG